MSYYILPKNDNELVLNPSCCKKHMTNINCSCSSVSSEDTLSASLHLENKPLASERNDDSFDEINHNYCTYNPFISSSYLRYLTTLNNEKTALQSTTDLKNAQYINKLFSPEFYVHKFYLALFHKDKPTIYFHLTEMIKTFSIFDCNKVNKLNVLLFSHSLDRCVEYIECLNDLNCNESVKREFSISYFYKLNSNTDITKIIEKCKFHLFFFEIGFDIEPASSIVNYIFTFSNLLLLILRNMHTSGSVILRVSDLFYKPIVDILYYLTSLFETVFIFKPSSSGAIESDKYIVCKHFKKPDENKMKLNYYKLFVFLKKLNGGCIQELIAAPMSHLFITKLEEINVIIGQQQLETINSYINMCKNSNKNKGEKLELMHKNNLNKTIAWYKKYFSFAIKSSQQEIENMIETHL
jgi:hypothetical protein